MEKEIEEAKLTALRAAVAEGLAQSLRGESASIDFAELKRELRANLSSRASRGILPPPKDPSPRSG